MVWTQYFVPLNSPDLNPTDYFVWGVVGSKANEHRVASRDTPKHQITEVTDSIDKEGWHVRARASGPVSRRSLIGRVITLVHTWLRIGVVMMLRCYNAVFRYIFLSMTFLTCWQIFPDYAAPPCRSHLWKGWEVCCGKPVEVCHLRPRYEVPVMQYDTLVPAFGAVVRRHTDRILLRRGTRNVRSSVR